jgi:DNA-binding MarR family transcriptional regulator
VTRWLERALAPLTLSQFLVLRALAREPLEAGELARRAGVSAPAMSQLVASLEAERLVERVARADRRRWEIKPTSRGLELLEQASTTARVSLTPILGELPKPEQEQLGRALQRIEAVLAGTPPPSRPARRPPKHLRPHHLRKT